MNGSNDPFRIIYDGCGIDRLSNTKVGDFCRSIRRDHDVMRFHIAVNNMIFVGECQRCCDLLGQRDHLRIRHRTLLFDIVAEGFALNQFHYYVMYVSLPSYIVDIYDIRVRKAGCRL